MKCKYKCYKCNEIGSFNCCNICKRNMCLDHSFDADKEKAGLAKQYRECDYYDYGGDYLSFCVYFCEACNRDIMNLRNQHKSE